MPDFTAFDLSAIDQPWLQTTIALAALIAVAWFANWITKLIVFRVIQRALSHVPFAAQLPHGGIIVRRLSNIVPVLVIQAGIHLVPHIPAAAVTVTRNVATAFIILTVALALSAALTLANDLYYRRPDADRLPIKGYIQVVKLLVFCGTAVLIIATLMERSPLLLLSGLGAMAAVLMLVFRDTILSLVASVQINSNDIVRIGDWIEMPNLDADGDVIDIALHTVKVQNWDKTITTIPTHMLISESFKNWRGMVDSGGRRIKRAVMIDQASVRFLDDAEIADLRAFSLLKDYLRHKEKDVATWNAAHTAGADDTLNARRLTNIGTFRAYVDAYLRDHPDISKEMTLMVRQLSPSEKGLPLEVYCFTTTTEWGAYEAIQSDIFDHLIAILPVFGLRVYQLPSGADFRGLGDAFQTEEPAAPPGP